MSPADETTPENEVISALDLPANSWPSAYFGPDFTYTDGAGPGSGGHIIIPAPAPIPASLAGLALAGGVAMALRRKHAALAMA